MKYLKAFAFVFAFMMVATPLAVMIPTAYDDAGAESVDHGAAPAGTDASPAWVSGTSMQSGTQSGKISYSTGSAAIAADTIEVNNATFMDVMSNIGAVDHPQYPIDGNYVLTEDINVTDAQLTGQLTSEMTMRVTVQGHGVDVTLIYSDSGNTVSVSSGLISIGGEVTDIIGPMMAGRSGFGGGAADMAVIVGGSIIGTGDFAAAFSVPIDGDGTYEAKGYASGNLQPIGTAEAPFKGTFDGNGHTITGLKVMEYSTRSAYAGLFAYTHNATIKNLGLKDGTIVAAASAESSAYAYAGGLVGYANGTTVSCCYNDSSIYAISSTSSANTSYAGGVAGFAVAPNITNCYNTGQIGAYSASGTGAGGITGGISGMSSTIYYCYNTGTVNATYDDKGRGGIAGRVNTTGEDIVLMSDFFMDSKTAKVPVLGTGTVDEVDSGSMTADDMRKIAASETNYPNWDFGTIWNWDPNFENDGYPTLQVLSKPLIDITGADDTSGYEGRTATFKVSTDAPSPKYQWSMSTDGGSNWNDIDGATSAEYDTPELKMSDDRGMYRCVVTTDVGPVKSRAATLAVSDPLMDVTLPSDGSVTAVFTDENGTEVKETATFKAMSGTEVTFSLTDPDSKVAYWIVDGATVYASGQSITKTVEKPMEISAAEGEHKITIQSDEVRISYDAAGTPLKITDKEFYVPDGTEIQMTYMGPKKVAFWTYGPLDGTKHYMADSSRLTITEDTGISASVTDITLSLPSDGSVSATFFFDENTKTTLKKTFNIMPGTDVTLRTVDESAKVAYWTFNGVPEQHSSAFTRAIEKSMTVSTVKGDHLVTIQSDDVEASYKINGAPMNITSKEFYTHGDPFVTFAYTGGDKVAYWTVGSDAGTKHNVTGALELQVIGDTTVSVSVTDITLTLPDDGSVTASYSADGEQMTSTATFDVMPGTEVTFTGPADIAYWTYSAATAENIESQELKRTVDSSAEVTYTTADIEVRIPLTGIKAAYTLAEGIAPSERTSVFKVPSGTEVTFTATDGEVAYWTVDAIPEYSPGALVKTVTESINISYMQGDRKVSTADGITTSYAAGSGNDARLLTITDREFHVQDGTEVTFAVPDGEVAYWTVNDATEKSTGDLVKTVSADTSVSFTYADMTVTLPDDGSVMASYAAKNTNIESVNTFKVPSGVQTVFTYVGQGDPAYMTFTPEGGDTEYIMDSSFVKTVDTNVTVTCVLGDHEVTLPQDGTVKASYTSDGHLLETTESFSVPADTEVTFTAANSDVHVSYWIIGGVAERPDGDLVRTIGKDTAVSAVMGDNKVTLSDDIKATFSADVNGDATEFTVNGKEFYVTDGTLVKCEYTGGDMIAFWTVSASDDPAAVEHDVNETVSKEINGDTDITVTSTDITVTLPDNGIEASYEIDDSEFKQNRSFNVIPGTEVTFTCIDPDTAYMQFMPAGGDTEYIAGTTFAKTVDSSCTAAYVKADTAVTLPSDGSVTATYTLPSSTDIISKTGTFNIPAGTEVKFSPAADGLAYMTLTPAGGDAVQYAGDATATVDADTKVTVTLTDVTVSLPSDGSVTAVYMFNGLPQTDEFKRTSTTAFGVTSGTAVTFTASDGTAAYWTVTSESGKTYNNDRTLTYTADSDTGIEMVKAAYSVQMPSDGSVTAAYEVEGNAFTSTDVLNVPENAEVRFSPTDASKNVAYWIQDGTPAYGGQELTATIDHDTEVAFTEGKYKVEVSPGVTSSYDADVNGTATNLSITDSMFYVPEDTMLTLKPGTAKVALWTVDGVPEYASPGKDIQKEISNDTSVSAIAGERKVTLKSPDIEASYTYDSTEVVPTDDLFYVRDGTEVTFRYTGDGHVAYWQYGILNHLETNSLEEITKKVIGDTVVFVSTANTKVMLQPEIQAKYYISKQLVVSKETFYVPDGTDITFSHVDDENIGYWIYAPDSGSKEYVTTQTFDRTISGDTSVSFSPADIKVTLPSDGSVKATYAMGEAPSLESTGTFYVISDTKVTFETAETKGDAVFTNWVFTTAEGMDATVTDSHCSLAISKAITVETAYADKEGRVYVTLGSADGSIGWQYVTEEKVTGTKSFWAPKDVDVTFTASPADGAFIRWTFNDSPQAVAGNPYTRQFTEDTTVTATVSSADDAGKYVNLTVNSDNGTVAIGYNDGTDTLVSVSGSSTFAVPKGADVTFTASPADGYGFLFWNSPDSIRLGDTFTASFDGDATVTAEYSAAEDIAKVNVDASGNPVEWRYTYNGTAVAGEVTDRSAVTVPKGVDVTFEATVPEGSVFGSWTSSDAGDVTDNPFTRQFTQDADIKANVADDPGKAAVTVDPAGGTVKWTYGTDTPTNGETTSVQTISIPIGVDVTFSEIAPDGTRLTYWLIDGNAVAGDPLTLKIAGDMHIQTKYQNKDDLKELLVDPGDGTATVTYDDDGTAVTGTAVSMSNYLVPSGARVTVTATAADGKAFMYWYVGNQKQGGNPFVSEIADNTYVTAVSESKGNVSAVTIDRPDSGMIEWRYSIQGVIIGGTVDEGTGSVEVNIPKDASLSLTATPGQDRQFVFWTIGNEGFAGNPYTGTFPNDTVIAANFVGTADAAKADIDPQDGKVEWEYINEGTTVRGSMDTADTLTVPKGAEVTFTSVPSEGSDLMYWSIDSSAIAGNPYSMTIDRDTDIVARTSADAVTVTVTASGGMISIAYNDGIEVEISVPDGTVADVHVPESTDLMFTAMPAEGMELMNWNVNGMSYAEERHAAAFTNNVQVTARFGHADDIVELSVDVGGSYLDWRYVDGTESYGTMRDGILKVPKGTDVFIQARADDDRVFTAWTFGDASPTAENPCIRQFTQDTAITAGYISSADAARVDVDTSGGTVEWTYEVDGASVNGSTGSNATIMMPKGTEITFTATPDDGNAFRYVSAGDVKYGSDPCSLTVTADMTVTAVFDAVAAVSVITVEPPDSGVIEWKYGDIGGTVSNETGPVDVNVPKDADVQMTYVPDEGTEFISWAIGGNGSSDNPYIGKFPENTEVTVNCADAGDTVTMTVEASGGTAAWEFGGNGIVVRGSTSSGTFNVPKDVDVTFTASADNGYVFRSWSVGSNVISTNPFVRSFADDASVIAEYADSASMATVAVDPGDGSVSWTYNDGTAVTGTADSAVSFTVPKDVDVTFTATAPDGYVFQYWITDSGRSGDAELTATFVNDTTVKAVFIDNTAGGMAFTVNVGTENGSVSWSYDDGAVSGTSGRFSVPAGTAVLLDVTPDDGYEFIEWNGALSGQTNPASVEILGDMEMTATCGRSQFTVTTVADTHSMITSTATVDRGGDMTVTFSAEAGYRIVRETIDGIEHNELIQDGKVTFTNITDDHTVEITTEPIVVPGGSGDGGSGGWWELVLIVLIVVELTVLTAAVAGGLNGRKGKE